MLFKAVLANLVKKHLRSVNKQGGGAAFKISLQLLVLGKLTNHF